MPADNQLRIEPPVELRTVPIIADLKAIFIDIVVLCPGVFLILIACCQYARAVHFKGNGDGIERMTGQWIKIQRIFFPLDRFFHLQTAIHCDWVVPQTRQIMCVGTFEYIREEFRRPYLRPLHGAQKVDPGNVIVMIMGRDHHIDLRNAEIALERGQRIQPADGATSDLSISPAQPCNRSQNR